MPSFKNTLRAVLESFGTGGTVVSAHRRAARLDAAEGKNSKKREQQAAAYSQKMFGIAKQYLDAFINGADKLDRIKELVLTSGVLILMQGTQVVDTSALSKRQVQQLQTYALELVESQRDHTGERPIRGHMREKSQQLDEATRAAGDRTKWSRKQP